MAKEAKTITPLFQLRAVELHELSIHRPQPGAVPITNFNFEINVENNVDAQQKIVIASTNIKIKGDGQSVLGSLICACVFSVVNFEEVVMMGGRSKAEINESFAETINSIAISTTRGVMASELKGTMLHYAFLPLIDIKTLSKNPVG